MKTALEYERELIQKARPSMSYDGKDYEAWKKQARAKLSDLLCMDKYEKTDPDVQIEYESRIAGATEIRFTFQSEPGYRVPAHLFVPDGVENPPLMIALQGHSTGMHISFGRPKYSQDADLIAGGDRDFCLRALKEGYASVAMEQRSFGECGTHGEGCRESTMTALLMGRTIVGERVWDVMRLIDVMEMKFGDKVDMSALVCMGNSGGGVTTSYVAALEDRVVLAMPSCSMCTYKDSFGAMSHCPCSFIPHITEYFEMGDLIAMAYPKKYIQVSGVEDAIFPFQYAEEVFHHGRTVYEQNGKVDECVLVKGFGGHRFYADDAWPVVHKLLGR